MVCWASFVPDMPLQVLCGASFVPMGTWGRSTGGRCALAAAPNEAATRSTSHADPSAAVVCGVSGRCSVISHAIPFKFHAFLFQFVTTCHLCCGIACDLREGLGLHGACDVLGAAYGCWVSGAPLDLGRALSQVWVVPLDLGCTPDRWAGWRGRSGHAPRSRVHSGT